MKKILLLSLLLLTGCSGGDRIIEATASLTWIALYQVAGGAGFHLTQTNGTTLTTIVNPVVSGNSFIMPITGCDVSYDISTIDPVNTAYWLSQPLTVDYDKGMFSCATAIQCTVHDVTMIGGIATADFTCI